jgi:hypothetical protein
LKARFVGVEALYERGGLTVGLELSAVQPAFLDVLFISSPMIIPA